MTEQNTTWCVWPGCQLKRWKDIPICRVHAEIAARRTQDVEPDSNDVAAAEDLLNRARQLPERPSVVYYLLVKPGVVKIGYSSDFATRLTALRCDLSHLLALEAGGREEERARHRQFANDRIIRLREDFKLSPDLQRHIETLQPNRSELLQAVMNRHDRR